MLWTMDLSELLPLPSLLVLLRRSQSVCCESELETDDERFIEAIVLTLLRRRFCRFLLAVSPFSRPSLLTSRSLKEKSKAGQFVKERRCKITKQRQEQP